jgi:hypothetical protein
MGVRFVVFVVLTTNWAYFDLDKLGKFRLKMRG